MENFKLSRREEQILLLSMSGLNDKEIALRMNLSTDTVRTYWKRIRSKVGGSNRSEIIALMVRQGFQEELQAKQSENEQLLNEIAKRRNAEEALRIYRSAFDRSIVPQMIVSTDDNRIRQANNKLAALLGYPGVELLGKPLGELLEPGAVRSVMNELMRVGSGEASFECKHVRKDGSTFNAEVSTFTTALDGVAGFRIFALLELL